jgi:hypothetical protein
MCGTTRPTNPIIPLLETIMELMMLASVRSTTLSLVVLMPRVAAFLSPSERIFIFSVKKYVITSKGKKVRLTQSRSFHDREEKEPISQKTMVPTSSPAIYFIKLRPAEKKEFTIIPASISDVLFILLSIKDIAIVSTRLIIENRKAKNDVVKRPKKLRLNIMARAEPKDAPDETPSI